jgi:protein-S-isoprenylcysteine O-methyltransferase Ste14
LDSRPRTEVWSNVDRIPLFAIRSYFFLQIGYLLQSLSLRNALVVVFICSCNIGRAVVEERLLKSSTRYDEYRANVPWRLLPGVW